jgi:hypothetical protein
MADTVTAGKDAVTDVSKEEIKETVQDVGGTVKEKVKEYVTPAGSRVEENTPEEISRQIRRDLKARVLYFAERPEEIDRRLDELDREWDIERLLEANAGIFSLVGLTFGEMRSRWYILPAAVGAFLVQHAVRGWCPPAALLRRLGIRTTREINHERYALKALRGDFDTIHAGENLGPEERARRAIDAADTNV